MTNPGLIDAEPDIETGLGDRPAIVERLGGEGYGFVAAGVMRQLLDARGSRDRASFARSWDDLAPDDFMADGGTYRKRRFGCFTVSPDAIVPKPPQPHFQTVEHNPLNGGIDRVFAPLRGAIATHPATRAVLMLCRDLFTAAMPAASRPRAWHAEMHQFRIEARAGQVGKPTPEGLHRDGVDWVVVMMVRRENVTGGESTVADGARRPLQVATLRKPLDSTLLDDRRVLHGVSPVRPRDPSRPAWRDVLVVTFRGEA